MTERVDKTSPGPLFTGCLDTSLLWRHNGRSGVSNHQPHDCLLIRSFRRRSKKTSKLRITGLCAGNSPVTGEFPAQMASNAENVSIWWRHHVMGWLDTLLGDQSLIIRSRETTKMGVKIFSLIRTLQPFQQHYCRGACQISNDGTRN